MNKSQWSLFSLATISLLTLISSGLPALAQSGNRSPQIKQESVNCSELEVETLIGRWRESYLPAGEALRSCGDSAVTPLAEVMADGTVEIRTRQLSARLIRQIGSEPAVKSLITALGNYQTQDIAWASLQTMHEQPESQLIETISSLMVEEDMPLSLRAGAIRFVELYADWQVPSIVRNTSEEMINTLLVVISNETEESHLRAWAADALATLVYTTGGDYPAEAVQPEALASVVSSESNPAVRQSTMNVLMMTYYVTVTHRACDFRQAEVVALEQALLSIGDLSNASRVQELAVTPDEVEQTSIQAALRNVMNIAHPKGQDVCPHTFDTTPGIHFVNHVKRSNQPRLFEQLVQWANTLS